MAAGDPIEVAEIKPRLPEVKSRNIETKEEKRDSDQYLVSIGSKENIHLGRRLKHF